MVDKYTQFLRRLCYSLIIPVISVIHIKLNTYRPNIHVLKTFIDDIIPFNKYFVLPYIYWFLYVFLALVFFAAVDYRYYFRLLTSIVAGMLMCFMIFYFFPTTVPRPEVIGNDLFTRAVRLVYSKDNPYNCFPSIHVLNALLVTLFLCDYTRNKYLKGFYVISCVSICLSTLFIRQHYVLDVFSASIIGASAYMLFSNGYLWSRIPAKYFISLVIPSNVRDNLNSP